MTRKPMLYAVPWSTPRIDSPKRTAAHAPSISNVGTASCFSLTRNGVFECAAANPPTKKNRPSVCSTQLNGVSSGKCLSGLSMYMPVGVSTSAVTSQCPSTTVTTAIARTASMNGFLSILTPPSAISPTAPITSPPPSRSGRAR
ncbi:hypothetical protein UK23_13370 [Lentzea aerocolonigenes]|uniref:Uncharacterized protein n=1 Tax=Lentzea aerocolonigenes TaxID=68170 RepID=A0A0F0H7M3_LENAE|nr:hypothetical protein UK23_13370 [Lentzea aerocolonigenes]